MPPVTATQPDPSKPGAEDWRPTSAVTLEQQARADFLKDEGWPGEDRPTKGKSAPVEDDDEDLEDASDEEDDLDEDDNEEEEVVTKKPAPKGKAKPVEPEKDEPDDDSDLDEEDEAEVETDPAVAKSMQKLQKQEQRMRAQMAEKETKWTDMLAKERDARGVAEKERDEARTELARLRARAKDDPASVLEELGVDDWDYTSKQAFVRSKAGADPANKEAAARLRELRELKAAQAEVKKELDDRKKADEEARKSDEMRGKVEVYLGNLVKSAASVKKASLTQRLVKEHPDVARVRFSEAAARLYKGGDFPSPREVIIEVEKQERAVLRRYGINPRTLAATPANGNGKPTTNGKAAKGKRAVDDDLKMPTKEELLAEDWDV